MCSSLNNIFVTQNQCGVKKRDRSHGYISECIRYIWRSGGNEKVTVDYTRETLFKEERQRRRRERDVVKVFWLFTLRQVEL